MICSRHFSKLLSISCFLTLLFTAVGCRFFTKKIANDSTAKHNSNQFLQSSSPTQWLEVTNDVKMPQLPPGEILPESHPMALRLQFWIDAIDTKVRSSNPDSFKGVPEPKLTLIKGYDANAFVAAVNVCYPIRVKVNPLSQEYVKEIVNVFSPRETSIENYNFSDKCNFFRNDEASLQEVIAHYNEQLQGQTNCRLLKFENELSFSGNCKKVGPARNSNYFAFPATLNRVFVNSKLFTLLDDEFAMVGILAHELSHYYRSHATSAKGTSEYFYARLASRAPGKPNPVWRSDLQRDFDILAETSTAAIPREVGAQFYTGGVYEMALRGNFPKEFNLLCVTQKCKQFLADFQEINRKEIFKREELPFENHQAFNFRFFKEMGEKRILELFQAIDYVTLNKETSARKNLFYNLAGGYESRGEWAGQMELEFKTRPTQNLLELMSVFDSMFKLARQKHSDTISRVLKSGFGWYTVEEEADSMAAEIFAKLNINPRLFAKSFFGLFKQTPDAFTKPMAIQNFNYTECLGLFENRWMKNGMEVIVPFGADTLNIHHEFCYRIYNIDKEIERHGYRVDASQQIKPPANSPSWADLVAEFK